MDLVATDKKGQYVKDLGPKDFQVFENKKLQEIKSFSPPGEARDLRAQPSRITLCSSSTTPR